MYEKHKFNRRSVLKSIESTIALAAFSSTASGRGNKGQRELDVFSISIPDLRVRNLTGKHVSVRITPEPDEDKVLFTSSFGNQGIASQGLPNVSSELGGEYGDRFSVHVKYENESVTESFDKTRLSRYSGLLVSVDQTRGVRIHTAEV